MPPGSCTRLLLLLTFTSVTGCAFHLPSPPLTTSYTRSYLSGPSVARSQIRRSQIRRSQIRRSAVARIQGRAAILRALSGAGCPYPTSARAVRRIGNVYVSIPWCDEPDPRSVGDEHARERNLEEQLRRHDQQSREAEPLPPVSAPPPPQPRQEAIIYPLAATPEEESHEDSTTRELEGPRVYRVPAASGSR
jgi:hypothetical protein